MFKILFFIHVFLCLEINKKMGFGKSQTRDKLLITNGHYPVPFTLHFENQLIDPEEATAIGNIAVKCPDTKPLEVIDRLNENLIESFVAAFKNLEMDQNVKSRGERGVLVSAGVAIGMAAVEKLMGKGIDYLFNSRRHKTEKAVSELKESLYTIKNELELSSLELCALGQNVLQEKINRISLELSLDIENQIKSQLQNLYFGKLDRKYQLDACLALNENVNRIDCVHIIKAQEFEFNIISVEVFDEHASIQIQIMTPIVSKYSIGFYYYNFGVPKTINDKNVFIKGLIPDFVSEQKFYKFKAKPKYNVISQHDIVSDTEIDIDCFHNTNDTDKVCDSTITPIASDFLLKTINGESFLLNFIPCSYTLMNNFDEPNFFDAGIHHIKLQFGFLTCGQERLEFSHISIHTRSLISYNNFSMPFNYRDQETFKNLYNRNIFDEDHVFEQVEVIPRISFRVVIITTLFVISLVALIVLCWLYKQSLIFKQQLRRPALVY